MNKYPLTLLIIVTLFGAVLTLIYVNSIIKGQNEIINQQEHEAGILKKKIQLIESKINPDSTVLQGSYDGIHWETMRIESYYRPKYIRVKITQEAHNYGPFEPKIIY